MILLPRTEKAWQNIDKVTLKIWFRFNFKNKMAVKLSLFGFSVNSPTLTNL